jgi:hypothetical protein
VDDGKTVDGPRHATMKAIVKGINEVYKYSLSIIIYEFPFLPFRVAEVLVRIYHHMLH